MKHKYFSFILSLLCAGAISAQCTPDFDFGGEAFGVSPNPTNGESLEQAVLDVPYSDVIHFIVPVDGSAFGAGLDQFTIDSVVFNGLNLTDGAGADLLLADVGLMLECNNVGTAPNPCNFIGGSQACALISGTPSQAGIFNADVDATIFYSLGIVSNSLALSTVQQTSFELVILSDPDNINDLEQAQINVAQNFPNPCKNKTTIECNVPAAGQGQVTIMNLVGDQVFENNYSLTPGENTILLDLKDLQSGIYLYAFSYGTQQVTKRMVINK